MKDDTISRRLAIDKFAAYIYHAFKDFYRIGLHRKTLTPEQCRRVARNVLAEVPSAQPYTDEEIQKVQELEQAQFDKIHELAYREGKADAMRWIPCSERLPEKRGFYLTTTKDKAVYCDHWNEDNFDRTEMVIAWMPLPEPYGEVSE